MIQNGWWCKNSTTQTLNQKYQTPNHVCTPLFLYIRSILTQTLFPTSVVFMCTWSWAVCASVCVCVCWLLLQYAPTLLHYSNVSGGQSSSSSISATGMPSSTPFGNNKPYVLISMAMADCWLTVTFFIWIWRILSISIFLLCFAELFCLSLRTPPLLSHQHNVTLMMCC